MKSLKITSFVLRMNWSNHVHHVVILKYNIGASINDDVDVQYLNTKIGRFISV